LLNTQVARTTKRCIDLRDEKSAPKKMWRSVKDAVPADGLMLPV
jgi:hypothetical protein